MPGADSFLTKYRRVLFKLRNRVRKKREVSLHFFQSILPYITQRIRDECIVAFCELGVS